jgi:homoserine dehydrogenase
MNAVLVMADAVGPTLYYGAGAGAMPTGSAVVADLVDVVRSLTTDPDNRVPHLAFRPDALSEVPILPVADIESAYYLRLLAADKPGVMGQVTTVLGEAGISIEAIMQKESDSEDTRVPVILLTQRVREKQIDAAIKRIESLDTIAGKVTRIRVETLQ